MRLSIQDWFAIIDARKDEVLTATKACESERAPAENPGSNPLVSLGEKYQPTKRLHNYLPRYDHVFGPVRQDVRTFVEIGVQTDKSLKMWRDYFPNARILGIDIDPDCKQFEGDRVEVYIGDQMDPNFLKSFIQEVGAPLDIVVDDGLHTSDAIMASFSYLYPALGSYGIYAIEDIMNNTVVDAFLMDCIRAIQHWPNDLPAEVWPIVAEFEDDSGWFVRNTIGLEVYRFIAFVKRGFNPRSNPYFLDEENFFAEQTELVAKVDGFARLLAAEGQEVTREKLVERIGFHKRYAVDWYLSDIRAFNMDAWRQCEAERQSSEVPPLNQLKSLELSVSNFERIASDQKLQISRLERKLCAVHNSKSWRLTRPLRRLRSWLRRASSRGL